MGADAIAPGALALIYFSFTANKTPLSNCIHIIAVAITELLQLLSYYSH